MIVSEIKLYEIFKVKFGEKEAEVIVEGIKQEVKEELAAQKEILATKADIHNLKIDIEKLRSEFLVVKWMLGLILAGILSLIVKIFF